MGRIEEGDSNEVAAHADKNPATTNSRVGNALGIDWSTWSKPKCHGQLLPLMLEVFDQFRTQNENAWWGHGYKGHDLAAYGCCVSRGDALLVNLPARAMEYIRYVLKIPDAAVCRWFLERDFKATRIDLALDTAERGFNPLTALMSWHRGLVRCAAQEWDFRLSHLEPGVPILPPNGKGMTTYVGSPHTGRRLRIYDKVTEALEKTGEVLTDGRGCEIPHLTRLELQHRDDAAAKVSELIAAEGLKVIPELISGYITFLSHRDPRKRERKRVAKWWQRIVGNLKRALELERGTATPDDSIFWIEKQATTTLKLIKEKAPDAWKRLLTRMKKAEVRKGTLEKWKAWKRKRDERIKDRKEIEEFERCERVLETINRKSIYGEEGAK